MKKGWFIAGGIFVLTNIIYLIYALIQRLSHANRVLMENVFIGIGFLLSICLIILGIYFLRIGSKELTQGRVLNTGLRISLIGFCFVILGGTIALFSKIIPHKTGQIIPIIPSVVFEMGLLIFSIFNVVTFILAAIHYFKNR